MFQMFPAPTNQMSDMLSGKKSWSFRRVEAEEHVKHVGPGEQDTLCWSDGLVTSKGFPFFLFFFFSLLLPTSSPNPIHAKSQTKVSEHIVGLEHTLNCLLLTINKPNTQKTHKKLSFINVQPLKLFHGERLGARILKHFVTIKLGNQLLCAPRTPPSPNPQVILSSAD